MGLFTSKTTRLYCRVCEKRAGHYVSQETVMADGKSMVGFTVCTSCGLLIKNSRLDLPVLDRWYKQWKEVRGLRLVEGR